MLQDRYNVVYFHPRGGGLSQFPASKEFDKYLTSDNIVDDLDAIRADLRVRRWDMVYAFSHGTLVAQKYGHKFPARIKRFVYDGTTTWWSPRNKLSFFRQTPINVRRLLDDDRDHLFEKLTPEDKTKIEHVVTQIFDDTSVLGGIQTLMNTETYHSPENIKAVPILGQHSLEFFLAAYFGLYTGWSPVNPEVAQKQKAVSVFLAGEMFPKKIDRSAVAEARAYLLSQKHTVIPQIKSSAKSNETNEVQFPGFSNRTFLVVHAPEAEFYDPRNYPHSIETYQFHGSGDGASPVEGAYEVFNSALTGKKVLIVANGANHGAFFKGQSCEKLLLMNLVESRYKKILTSILEGAHPLTDGIQVER